MKHRKKEIELVLEIIIKTLKAYALTLTVDMDKGALMIIDELDSKRYYISKGGSDGEE